MYDCIGGIHICRCNTKINLLAFGEHKSVLLFLLSDTSITACACVVLIIGQQYCTPSVIGSIVV